MKGVLHLSFLSTIAVSQVLADNFVASCDANSVKITGRDLTANCKDIFGNLQCSKLDLNRCLKNTYGSLQEDPKGDGYVEIIPRYDSLVLQVAMLTGMVTRPHFGDQCISCSNEKTTSGVLISGPTLMHCQCDPKTGAAQANWPTAIFDISMYHHE